MHSGLLVAAEEQRVGLPALANYPMVLPSAPNAIRHLLDSVLGPRHIELQVLAEVGAVHTVLALVATGVGCTILPESAVAAIGDEALPRAPIGPPASGMHCYLRHRWHVRQLALLAVLRNCCKSWISGIARRIVGRSQGPMALSTSRSPIEARR
ncbi:hypothetical protein J7E70_21810 [Variovorax paradoxus]|nr:hypothetical protein [Variovorax paradoxus]